RARTRTARRFGSRPLSFGAGYQHQHGESFGTTAAPATCHFERARENSPLALSNRTPPHPEPCRCHVERSETSVRTFRASQQGKQILHCVQNDKEGGGCRHASACYPRD